MALSGSKENATTSFHTQKLPPSVALKTSEREGQMPTNFLFQQNTMSDDSNSSNIKKNNTARDKKEKKTIFVTVGTTRFDKLIDAVTSEASLDWMISNGYSNLTIQYGTGNMPSIPNTTNASTKKDHDTREQHEVYYKLSLSALSSTTTNNRLFIKYYNFQPTLAIDMKQADTIISHAGAGTVMEALRLHETKLCVVINTELMDNHQTELASALFERGHLFVVNEPQELLLDDSSKNNKALEKWDQIEQFVPKPYNTDDCDAYDFPRLLDSFLGFNTAK